MNYKNPKMFWQSSKSLECFRRVLEVTSLVARPRSHLARLCTWKLHVQTSIETQAFYQQRYHTRWKLRRDTIQIAANLDRSYWISWFLQNVKKPPKTIPKQSILRVLKLNITAWNWFKQENCKFWKTRLSQYGWQENFRQQWPAIPFSINFTSC